ncbi:Splicing factor 3B subunit 3 [Phlyctochytrium bullatum]|nr:Splicing factor 3B subunit 3 [Phlyctochytrium bullatum]
MIGAVEKQKLVYILNRNSAADLTISSPLEAHKSYTLCYYIVGVDVGYENPIFAAIECDYGDSDQDPTGEAFKNVEKDGGGRFDTTRGIIIVASVVHRLKKGFFILVQTEDGDVFKITMDYEVNADGVSGGVQNLKIKYFDTIPVASGMKQAKFSQSFLYRVDSLGDDDDDQPEYESAHVPFDEETILPFQPRGLRNLTVVDEMDSLCPLIDARVMNLTDEDTPQIFTVNGRGARSSFRILRHGLEASEIAVSELPGNPNAVWTVKASAKDDFDSFIIVSFVNATLVLSIGETVEERTDTGFLDSTPTLMVGQLGDDALVQVYPQGIRHIRSDRRVSEWKAPGSKAIVRAAVNQRQVIIALSSYELVYFELDAGGQLNEYQERREMGAPVTALSLGNLPEGRQRSKFLAVGCMDNTVRIFSLDPDNCLGSLAIQAVSSPPESLAIIEMLDTGSSVGSTYLNIGLQNGVLLRTTLDSITGTISDSRLRFLGSKGVKLFHVKVQGMKCKAFVFEAAFLAMWDNQDFRIFVIERLGGVFNQHVVPLKYTPRRLVVVPHVNNFVIIESDHYTYSPAEKAQLLEARAKELAEEGGGEEFEPPQELPPAQFGLPRAEAGNWASCVRLINPLTGDTLSLHDLEDNNAAFCAQVVTFPATAPGETFVIVGGARGAIPNPRSCRNGILLTYKVAHDGNSLEFLHLTETEDIPNALCSFHGRLLNFPNCIVTLHTQGYRIIAGDVQESVHYCVYIPQDNKIYIFADDTQIRWITTTTMLDYDTVAGGDKFGNIFVTRLAPEVSAEVDDDPSGNKLLFEKGFLHGAPHKVCNRVCALLK